MSFSQQSRSDLAAGEAEARRKQLAEGSVSSSSRPSTEVTSPSGGVIARFRAWVRRALAR